MTGVLVIDLFDGLIVTKLPRLVNRELGLLCARLTEGFQLR